MVRIGSAIICFVCLVAAAALSGAAEATDDLRWVESAGQRIRQAADAYLRDTARARFAYEYTGRFLDEDDQRILLERSRLLRDALAPILQQQKERLNAMEQYNGADWDDVYGRTGLWRRLRSDWLSGNWWMAQSDYYAAMASSGSQRETVCRQLLKQSQDEEGPFVGPAGRVLRARVLALMGQTDPAAKTEAFDLLSPLLADGSPAIPDPVRLSAMITYYSLKGSIQPNQVQSLAALCRKESCADQFELRLSAGFLELRLTSETMTILSELPASSSARSFAGSILLAELKDSFQRGQLGRETLSRRPLAAIRLAVEAAEAGGPQQYRDLLAELSAIPAFSRPQIDYVAARAWQEHSPVRAMEYYLRCSAEQLRQPDAHLSIDPLTLAEQAARVALGVFQKEPAKAGTVEPAIRWYCGIAGPKTDPAIQYGFVSVLRGCGKGSEADGLLERICREEGPYRNAARLDRIVLGLQGRGDSAKAGIKAAEELTQLMESIPAHFAELDGRVKADACHLLCRLLLESGEPANAQKALVLLEQNPGLERRRAAPLWACALRLLDRPVEAIRVLAAAAAPQDCNSVGEATLSLSAAMERVEEYEDLSTFGGFVADSDAVSEYVFRCAPAELRGHAALLRAEVLSMAVDPEKHAEAWRILEEIAAGKEPADLDWIRCRARLQESRGEFASAVKLWTQIADSLRTHTGQSPQPAWWQARYRALRCFARLPESKAADIEHAVQVLLSTHGPAPAPWDQKLRMLAR